MTSQGPSPTSQAAGQVQGYNPAAVQQPGASPAPSGGPGVNVAGQQPQQTAAPAAAAAGTVAAGPASTPSAQTQQVDHDPISKVKVLVPHLKESLSNLMKAAAIGFHSSASVDNVSLKTSDITAQRVDKSLEEFYSICDQVELYLRLGLDSSTQYVDGIRHSPLSTMKSDPATSGDSQTYNQYVSTAKYQVAYARDVHDALLDCINKLGEGKT